MDEKPIEDAGSVKPEATPIVENQDLKELLDTPAEVITAPPAPGLPTDEAQRVFQKFMDIANDILNNYKADRAQIEQTIQYLEQMSQLGPKGGRVYIEMLVAALRVKTDASMNAVKVMDAMAKMVSAGKGTPIFVQQNQGVAPAELAELLKLPKYTDEK